MLQVDLDNPHHAAIEIGVFVAKDKTRYLKAMYRYQLPDGTNRQIDQKFMMDFQQGRLRLVRRGGEVYCLFQREGEPQRLIRSYTVGHAPVKRVFMQSKCGDKVGASDVVLDEFRIVGESAD